MVELPTRVRLVELGPVKNSTFDTNAGLTADVAAVSATGTPIVTVDPETGAVSEIVGAVTVTFTVDDVAVALRESVTRLVMANDPETMGTQDIE